MAIFWTEREAAARVLLEEIIARYFLDVTSEYLFINESMHKIFFFHWSAKCPVEYLGFRIPYAN